MRADLDSLPVYVPGPAVPGAIKLASNEIALPPPPGVLAAIADAAAHGNRYPDFGIATLSERLAERHGVRLDQIAVGCGSVSVCQQLVQICCTGAEHEVGYAWRSFEAYPIITRVAGATPRTVPLNREHRHDLPALAAAITDRTRLVFVCNPNNPTGTAVTRAELESFLDAVPPLVLVGLDEAYREFVTDPDVPDGLDLLADHPNLVVLRTFSKAYRLAGLRVGYALAAAEVAQALRKVGVPFAVSAPAQAAALAALDVEAELLGACRDVTVERARVVAALHATGYPVPQTQANFAWLPLGAEAQRFAAHCAEQKVIVRPFAGDGVRVTIGSPGENDAFLAAAQSFAAESFRG